MDSKTELFAIKLPKKEKEAMNFTAQQTGKTLTKVFYKAIQHTIYEQLGLVLMEKLSRPKLDRNDVEEAKIPPFIRKNAPNIVVDFVHLIQEEKNKKEFRSIFSNLQFTENEYLLYEIDVSELASYLGEHYLDEDGSFDPVDLNHAKYLFFDYMIRMTFQLTAIGLMKTMDDEWSKNSARLERFRDHLISQYEEIYEGALEVVEVVEVVPYKDRKKK
jgi:hypothetical protein